MSAITYVTKDQSMPAMTVFDPLIDDEQLEVLKTFEHVYNPVSLTMIVYL